MENINQQIYHVDELEEIFKNLTVNDVLESRRVCKQWSQVVTTSLFLALFCRCQNIDWDLIPRRLKNDQDYFLLLMTIVRHAREGRNLLKNGCGQDGLNHWVIAPNSMIMNVQQDADTWFDMGIHSSMSQERSFNDLGLPSTILRKLVPFKIRITQDVSMSSADSSALYFVSLVLFDSGFNEVAVKEEKIKVKKTSSEKIMTEVSIPDTRTCDRVNYLRLTLNVGDGLPVYIRIAVKITNIVATINFLDII